MILAIHKKCGEVIQAWTDKRWYCAKCRTYFTDKQVEFV